MHGVEGLQVDEGWGSRPPCKQALKLLIGKFHLSSSYIPGMPEIFSSTSGEAPKVIPIMTTVEAEEHDSEFFVFCFFFFEKSRANKQIIPYDSTAQEVSALK